MSDTPLTDAHVISNATPYVHAEAARGIEMQLREEALKLEREVQELREKVRRLEKAGDRMLNAWLTPEDAMEYSDWVAFSSDAKSAWYTAKGQP